MSRKISFRGKSQFGELTLIPSICRRERRAYNPVAMENEPISLAQLIGTNILTKIPDWKGNEIVTVKLVGVEAGGIWIESQDFMENFFAGTTHTMALKTLAIFMPYSRILAIYAFTDTSWISKRVAQ